MFVHDTLLNLHAVYIEYFALQQTTRYVELIRLSIFEVSVVVGIRISEFWAVLPYLSVDGY
jgi:hypothetical protein